MMSIDPADDDDDDDGKLPPLSSSTPLHPGGDSTPRVTMEGAEGAVPQVVDLDTSGESHGTQPHTSAQISHQVQ